MRDSDLAVLWAHVRTSRRRSAQPPELGTALDPVIARGLAKRRRSGTRRAPSSSAPPLRQCAAARSELPPELDALVPLADREEEVAWLREPGAPRAGQREAPLPPGARGIGKTRVAAELAGTCTRRARRCATRASPARRRRRRRRARPSRRDRADAARARRPRRGRPSVIDHWRRSSGGRAGRSLLVLGTYRPGAELPRSPRCWASCPAQPPRAHAVRPGGVCGSPRCTWAGRPRSCPSRPCSRRPVASRPRHEVVSEWARGEASRRLAEAADRAADRPERSPRGGRRPRERRHRPPARAGAREPVRAGRRRARARAVPVQGPRELRDGRRARVLRPGAARRRARRPARRIAAARSRRARPGAASRRSCRPALCRPSPPGILPGSERWLRVLLRPGDHPMCGLARRSRRRPTAADGVDHVLVVVDQFEETFTACRDEAERAAFVERDHRRRPGRTAASPSSLAIRPPSTAAAPPTRSSPTCSAQTTSSSADAARGAAPGDRAARAPRGLRVEPRLIDALVADVGDEPGALPLLSTALLELWQERDGRTLRLERYEASGGIRGAVARLAERAYARLSEPQQTIARSVLLRLSPARRRGRCGAAPPLRVRPRRERGCPRGARGAHGQPAADGQRGHGRGRPRSAAAGMAPPARMARGRRGRPSPARAPDAGSAYLGGGGP